jgi:hypothetical protein
MTPEESCSIIELEFVLRTYWKGFTLHCQGKLRDEAAYRDADPLRDFQAVNKPEILIVIPAKAGTQRLWCPWEEVAGFRLAPE